MQDARQFQTGDRIQLLEMHDEYTSNIPIGATGTVISIAPPPINVLNIKWDTNFNLNPCLDVDRVVRI